MANYDNMFVNRVDNCSWFSEPEGSSSLGSQECKKNPKTCHVIVYYMLT